MHEVSPWVVVDGVARARDDARAPVWAPGVATAEGLFETLLVEDGRTHAASPHLDRLVASAAELGLALPPRADLEAAMDLAVATNRDWLGATPRALRLTVTPLATSVYLRSIAVHRRAGLHLWRVAGARALPRHKTLAWFPIERTHREGRDPAFEGAWLDVDGAVLEGNTTSLFAVVGDVVRTAPLARPLLPGVTRAAAITALAALGHPVDEVAATWDELVAASEVFATSSTLPIAPVLALEGSMKNEGPVTRALRRVLCERSQL